MPRVLILITLAEPGGAQTYVAHLLPALATRCEVVVAAYGDGPLRDAAREAGVRFVGLRHVRRALHPGRDLLGLLELMALIRRVRPDLVHANSSKAGVLGRLAAVLMRVPVRVFTVHGWAFKAYAGLASRLYRWADRLMGPLTSATICVSETERAAGLAARTCRARSTVVIPNAVDVDAAPRARHDGDPPRIVTVGRLAAPKDALTLVRALAALGPMPVQRAARGRRAGPARGGGGGPVTRSRGQGRAGRLADGRPGPAGRGGRLRAVEPLGGRPVLDPRGDGRGPAGRRVRRGRRRRAGRRRRDGAARAVRPIPRAWRRRCGSLLADPRLRRRLGAAGRARARERFDLRALRDAHLELYARELARRGVRGRLP